MALTNEDIQDVIEELIRRPELWDELCCRYPHVCCPPDKGLRGGGGGRGRQGPPGPPGPQEVWNTYTFSTRQVLTPPAGIDYFLEFSGTALTSGDAEARALTIQIFADVLTGHLKLPTRAGTLTGFNVLFTVARTIQVFVQINGVSHVVSNPIAVPPNIVTAIPLIDFPAWAPLDFLAIGFTDTTAVPVTLDMTVEIELTLVL